MTESDDLRRHQRPVRWVVAVACVALVSAACVPATQQAGAAPASTAPAGTAPPGIAWRACAPPNDDDPELQCATVSVPLDWSRPGGRRIDLAVIRHLASRPQERIGSMLVNPGGPGQSGVELVEGGGSDFDRWGGGRFDIVGWDPRGTNASSPVECFTSGAAAAEFWGGVTVPSTEAESAAYQQRTVDLARRCGEVSGELLDHISTADTARDLEALRVAVGDRELTYVGLSYGTLIGQTYANLFPDRVRAMMLDGLMDAAADTTSAEARTVAGVAHTDEVFAAFRAACQAAGPARCALARHPETVDQRVARLFDAARRAPIPAPHADPPGELHYGELLTSTFNPIRVPEQYPQFAADLDAAAGGDASGLETAARQMATPEAYGSATTSSAISCLDGPARRPSTDWPAVLPEFTRSSTLWGPVLGWWLWAPCASGWPVQGADRYSGPWDARTEAPILLINNRHDPATGYRNAQATERALGNAVLLTSEGYGHPTYQDPSACVDAARVRYLVDLATPPPGTVCQPDDPLFP
ncbi:alpha/beta hydrolase [Actinomycetospora cinnamomea]|uniref:Alpha/beta hydrolase family protein n=1 Tax=Actinomycetospora cinnamomea TaxID=663609 RepID=A0A2U1FQI6_9PSEU|nr:alpha/beta hydrolase [Actinomycetospora cinnamomea]PVZ14455.1 alpha/beta hydrolase family protein [Actinomycetospora cinnamomea]